jgi:hypothetical protein
MVAGFLCLVVTPCSAAALSMSDLFHECPQNTVQGDLVSGGETTFTMRLEDKERRRCEIAIHHQLRQEHTTRIEFQVKLASDWPRNDDRWASIFQLHSFTDPGEGRKCPIMAFEVIGGRGRAYNRWDPTPISDTTLGLCADKSTTIKSRQLFYGIPLDFEKWIDVQIVYKPSLTEAGRLTISINGHQVADATGPNMYNDRRGPYIKFGVYKPTGWTQRGPYTVSYRNLSIVNGED